jgi:hypothetical protein
MSRQKLNPSESELRESALEAEKWKQALHGLDDTTGWKTAKEIAEYLNLKPTATKERLRRGIEKGTTEMKEFLVCVNGRTQRKPYYRLL